MTIAPFLSGLRDWMPVLAAPRGRILALAAVSCLSFGPTTDALAAKGDCGQPSSSGSKPSAQDALYVLRTAVGSLSCDLCVCDANDNGSINAADALLLLKSAVGQPVMVSCPACEAGLTGVVLLPNGLAMASTGSPWSRLLAAVLGGEAHAAVRGLLPAAGATVELFDVDDDGEPVLPALASTVSGEDGSFSFAPTVEPGSRKLVRAVVDGQEVRAFVTADVVEVDPVTEFVVAHALEAVGGPGGGNLDLLGADEIRALVALVRSLDVDLDAAADVDDALAMLDDSSAGLYADVIASMATSAQADLAGGYNLLLHEHTFDGFQTQATAEDGGVTLRVQDILAADAPGTVSAGGDFDLGDIAGRRLTLTELSGSRLIPPDPATGVNASATLEEEAVAEAGPADLLMLGSADGSVLVDTGEEVGVGAAREDGSLVVLPLVFATPGTFEGGRFLEFAVREGSGLSNASLEGTWWSVHFEVELGAVTTGDNVHRRVEARQSAGTLTFNGSGGMTVGAAEGQRIRLERNAPPPEEPATQPFVSLTDEALQEDGQGLSCTLASDGELVVKDGPTVVARGAVTPDARVLVLRTGGTEDGAGSAGILVAVKRGSGMNTASGTGDYRSLSVGVTLQHGEFPGQVDVSADTDASAVVLETDFGSFTLDGQGEVTIQPSVQRGVRLREIASVLRRSMEPDLVFDAVVDVETSTDADDGVETADYSVASNGRVTVSFGPDATQEGYLSPDGSVFVLPQFEGEDDYRSVSVMLGLRQP